MVEKLFLAIMDRLHDYAEITNAIGGDHPVARRLCGEIMGMEEAFKIVAGVSYTDYLINRN